MSRPVAAIDIGSNTFRLLIGRPASPDYIPPWQTIYYTHRIVRLGEGLHHSQQLSQAGMQRALAAFHEFADIVAAYGVTPDDVHAVATAAMREAVNGPDFRQSVEDETGISIHIIDGDMEAAMALAGAVAVLTPETRENMLLFDIGGASTEFIRADNGGLVDAVSRNLGVVRLVEEHLKTDPPSKEDYQVMVKHADEHLGQVAAHWEDDRIPAHLVGTAGTVTTLAAIHLDLVPYDAGQVNNHSISKVAFTGLRDGLLCLTHAEREAMPTIEPGRADLMIAGLAIIEAIMKRWNFDRLVTVDAGLLEGAWLAAINYSAE